MSVGGAAYRLAREQGVVPPWDTMAIAIYQYQPITLCVWCACSFKNIQETHLRTLAQPMLDEWRLACYDPAPRCSSCGCHEPAQQVCSGSCICHRPGFENLRRQLRTPDYRCD